MIAGQEWQDAYDVVAAVHAEHGEIAPEMFGIDVTDTASFIKALDGPVGKWPRSEQLLFMLVVGVLAGRSAVPA